jgi:N6-adenosine-specific RNA methylase IME4
MSVQLVKYEQACRALAAAKAVDEVKHIRDTYEAIRTYARQANNKQLEIDASEIRFRAERRIGELMELQRETCGLAQGKRTDLGPKPTQVEKATLADVGIDKHLADRARKYAAISADQFETLMATRRERIAMENSRITINLLEEANKAEKRAQREFELAKRQRALPQRRYGVIVADPEWQFEPWSRLTGMDRSAANHYPTSATEVIAARPVMSIADEDSALGLWATVPMLPQALLVMGAWGFDYKTHWAWAKDRIGPGYWNRNKHEIFLFGTRGNVPCPAPGQQWDSLLEAPRRGHSEKPEIFLEMMEAYFPNLPKIELNRIGPPRPGWDAWGYEAELSDQATIVIEAAASC